MMYGLRIQTDVPAFFLKSILESSVHLIPKGCVFANDQ